VKTFFWGQIWWNGEDKVWGNLVLFLRRYGAVLAELWRWCLQSALNFEELNNFVSFQFISARTRVTSRFVYEAKFQVHFGCCIKFV